MLGPIEKGFKASELEKSPIDTYDGVSLSSLPEYISYKAGLLKQRATIKIVLLAVCILSVGTFAVQRAENVALQKKLREKEYILAPTVIDYTTVVPQGVPESYVNDAISDFVASLGNINAQNIDYQYSSIKRFMEPKLKIKFEMETADWQKQVQSENISQIFSISEKEITADGEGNYKAVVIGRADFYSQRQYLGYEDQIIEMQLRLTSPQNGRRWYVEIVTLKWDKADTFKLKRNIQGDPSTIPPQDMLKGKK